jgi:cation transport ATPase
MANRITAVVFDKTGTITHGNWILQKIMVLAPFDKDRALELAAGLEQNSDHFIGREILRQAQKRNIAPAILEDVRTQEKGLIGRFDGDIVKIGSADFLKDTAVSFDKLCESTTTRTAGGLDFTAIGGKKQGREVPQSLRVEPGATHPVWKTQSDVLQKESAYSYVYMSIGDRPVAVFVFGDRIRSGSRATVKRLLDRGFRLALVSGDGIETTRAIAKDIGIQDAYGSRMPNDKVAIIKTLQDQNHAVAMVGDGINDAPALVQADLSLAVHSGARLGEEVADVTLMRAEPEQVIDFLRFAGDVNKKISQNLTFTFAYNFISIPLAMSGLLTPLVAVSAMLLSSISVIGNTLMLVRKHSA